MRSLRKLNKGLLGRWVKSSGWDNDSFYCVGEDENYVYLWYGDYHGNDIDTIKSKIWQYTKDQHDFSVSYCERENDLKRKSWRNVITFNGINFNDNSRCNITWIK